MKTRKRTLQLTWFALRENARGIALTVAVTVLLISFYMLPVWYRSGPVQSVKNEAGTIETVLTAPVEPQYSIGRGFRYKYGVRLHHDQALVFVNDTIAAPHAIGSEVLVERVTRENGTTTFRFLP